ncbi:MAG: hypothetical protein ACOYJD_02865 [Christensenellales bacterium]|jgi:uncharacterized membrane protein
MGNEIFILFYAAITVYLFYAAITGKGQIYHNELLKEEKREEYHKITRIFCFIGGIISAFMLSIDLFGEQIGVSPMISLVFIAIMLVALTWYVIKTRPLLNLPPKAEKKKKKG